MHRFLKYIFTLILRCVCVFCRDINNGVYKTGFASTQEAYDVAVRELFAALDRVEEILSRQRYLTGPTMTEADVRLYTTLARFDPVYVGHFKVRCTINKMSLNK